MVSTRASTYADTETATGEGVTKQRIDHAFNGIGHKLPPAKTVSPTKTTSLKKRAVSSSKTAVSPSKKPTSPVKKKAPASAAKKTTSPTVRSPNKKTAPPSPAKVRAKSPTKSGPPSPGKKQAAASSSKAIISSKATPKRAVTKVREKDEEPGTNIYGEPQMRSDANQRLEQCIIFLSDEGPENYPDFKKNLRKLTYEIGTMFPLKKAAGEEGYDYEEALHRRVMAMVDVQKKRVEGAARRWFEMTMFPQYPPSESEPEEEYPMPSSSKTKFVLDEPIKTAKTTKAAKHGNDIPNVDGAQEMTKEEMAAYAKDPWAEEMPRPEVWHRRMPNSFPFGETPFMEVKMSEQISRDLGEGKSAIPMRLLWKFHLWMLILLLCRPGFQHAMVEKHLLSYSRLP